VGRVRKANRLVRAVEILPRILFNAETWGSGKFRTLLPSVP